MGYTLIEKIIAQHSPDKVYPGAIVWMHLDVRSARDFGGASVVKDFNAHYKGDKVADSSKTFFTFDCNAPANTIPYAENQRICRMFAKSQGIKVFDVQRGIGSHVLIEEGIVYPGSTVVSTDSHFNIMGAIGAFGQGMGDSDIAYGFRAGRTWFEVPPTVKVILEGTPPAGTTARDVTFAVMKKFGSSGALGKVLEIYGEAIDRMELAGRITLASQGTEIGAISIMLTPNDSLLDELHSLTGKRFSAICADPDAVYEDVVTIDVSKLETLVAAPPSPTNIKRVADNNDVKVDSVFIGSCTNGRYEDIAAAADILRGKRIAEGLVMFVVPATSKVYEKMLADGLLTLFYEAGALVSNPSCAGCASGQIGMTGSGEVMVSTSNRNFKGKQGNGLTYLASPQTAAYSALSGYICNRGR